MSPDRPHGNASPPDLGSSLARLLAQGAELDRAAQAATGVILAAGFSSRMGSFKPLLPLGGGTVLSQVVGTMQRAGLGHILVVTGHRQEEVAAQARALGVETVHNPDFEAGMFSSVGAGLAALDPARSWVLVQPVDVPLTRPWTYRLVMAGALASQAGQVHPIWQGQRGHPPLWPAAQTRAILAHQGGGGLRGALESLAGPVLELPAPDELMLADMDTPEQYQALQARLPGAALPSAQECHVLMLETLGVAPQVGRHCAAVAQVALVLGRACQQAGAAVDLALVRAGALLHDLAKGQPDHAQAGAAILQGLGLERVSSVVAGHADWAPAPGAPLGEAELVNLADKLCQGPVLVGLEPRFAAKLARHGADPAIRARIQARRDQARRLARRWQSCSGREMDQVLAQAGLRWGETVTE